MILSELFLKALQFQASSKTQRYFLSLSDIKERVNNLIFTVQALRDLPVGSNTIKVGEDWFSITDYQFPASLKTVIQTANVYFNEVSVGFVSPVLKAGSKLVNEGDHNLLRPLDVMKFFELYNEGQSDKVEVESLTTTNYVLFSQTGYLASGNALLIVNEEGKISEPVAVINQYKGLEIPNSSVRKVTTLTEQSIVDWLLRNG